MKLRYKILNSVLAILVIAVTALAIVLSYESECPPPMAAATGTDTMKAAIYRCYGSSDVIELADLPRPEPGDNEILVRIQAAAVNPLDWHFLTGTPYFLRLQAGLRQPKRTVPGSDVAGEVEAVGSTVTRLRSGDPVFGEIGGGSFAEYAAA